MRIRARFTLAMTALMSAIFVSANAAIMALVIQSTYAWMSRVTEQELLEITFSLRVLLESQLSQNTMLELRHSLTAVQGREGFVDAFLVNGGEVIASASPRRSSTTVDELKTSLGIDVQDNGPHTVTRQGDNLFSRTSICLPLATVSPAFKLKDICSDLFVVVSTQSQNSRLLEAFTKPVIFSVFVFLGSVSSFWLLMRRFLSARIGHFASYFAANPATRQMKPFVDPREDEFSFFSRVLNLFITQLNSTTEELRSEAHYDSLTGAMRRPRFQELYAHDHREKDYYLAITDIDDFKSINASHGHRVGDLVLARLTQTLLTIIPEAETICRFGGEDFLILVPVDAAGPSAADFFSAAVERIAATEMRFDNTVAFCTISLGFGLLRQSDNITIASERADLALRYAKATGKNRAVEADAHLLELLGYSVQTPKLQDLVKAIRSREIGFHLQPIVQIATGVPVGYEALVRWQGPDGSFVPLPSFINLFTAALRDKALVPDMAAIVRAALPPRPEGKDAPYFSFNYDPFDLFHQFENNALTPVLMDLVAEGYRIAIEVTETPYLERMQPDQIARHLSTIHDCGFLVFLDDFGKEGSGLERLASFDFAAVKADKSLITGLEGSGRRRHIIRLIVELTGSIGASLVVEGVETEEERMLLASLGVRYAQGYLFGKPSKIQWNETAGRGEG